MEDTVKTLWDIFYECDIELQDKIARQAMNLAGTTHLTIPDAFEVTMKTYKYLFKKGLGKK